MGDKEVTASPEVIAFVQGARWWEHHKENATMWPSDRRLAESQALRLEKLGFLGQKTH